MSFASRASLGPMSGGPKELRYELAGVAAEVATVNALARLALAARRQGCQLLLCGASEELRALIAFMGLAEVLRLE
jgi:ABC-type transporter Mla MlaB component